MLKSPIWIAALFSVALVSHAAQATTIYTDLAPGSSYDCCSGYAFGGLTGMFASTSMAAVEFTSSAYASVDRIDLALQNISGSDTAEVSLWTKSGMLPGMELASWMVSGLPSMGSSTSAMITISGIAGLTLAGGEHYFLALSPVSPTDDSANVWNANTMGATGKFAFSGGSGWFAVPGYTAVLPAFDIVGTQVPEPATIALALSGMAGAMRLRRRRTAQ